MTSPNTWYTCSFPEYALPADEAIPVRSANGFPRYKIRYPLVHALPSTFPAKEWVFGGLGRDEFTQRYLDMMNTDGYVDRVREEAAVIRRAMGVAEDFPLALLCFEQLAKKPAKGKGTPWCHRTIFAAGWTQLTGEPVRELGAVPMPETAAEERALDGLF
ncbi:hypothetical protein [Saccharothrix sp. HUAS TT1]|uniref:hypothetical protein n=1 Tax=unclassified Saccharothrix TaxID=2593673 RepID=UPI00345B9F0F